MTGYCKSSCQEVVILYHISPVLIKVNTKFLRQLVEIFELSIHAVIQLPPALLTKTPKE